MDTGIAFLAILGKLWVGMLLIGWIPALIAKKKGRNFLLWWLYGGALFLVALIHAAMLDDRGQPEGTVSLFEAQPYDPSSARKQRYIVIALVCVPIIISLIWLQFLYWPEEHVVGHFFTALQQQNYEQAYGIWMHDPSWKQHPQQYSRYPYNEFVKDWGPGGEWGIVKSYHIDGAKQPPPAYGGTPFATTSGVVVQVTVNDRVADKAHIWVQKEDKTLGFSPY